MLPRYWKKSLQFNTVLSVSTQGQYPGSVLNVSTQCQYSRSVLKVSTQSQYSVSVLKVSTQCQLSRSVLRVSTQGQYSGSVLKVSTQGQYSRLGEVERVPTGGVAEVQVQRHLVLDLHFVTMRHRLEERLHVARLSHVERLQLLVQIPAKNALIYYRPVPRGCGPRTQSMWHIVTCIVKPECRYEQTKISRFTHMHKTVCT